MRDSWYLSGGFILVRSVLSESIVRSQLPESTYYYCFSFFSPAYAIDIVTIEHVSVPVRATVNIAELV